MYIFPSPGQLAIVCCPEKALPPGSVSQAKAAGRGCPWSSELACRARSRPALSRLLPLGTAGQETGGAGEEEGSLWGQVMIAHPGRGGSLLSSPARVEAKDQPWQPARTSRRGRGKTACLHPTLARQWATWPFQALGQSPGHVFPRVAWDSYI